MKAILCTGHYGFVGSAVYTALAARGDIVLGWDAGTYAARPELKAMYTDVVTATRLPRVDAIIHCAAETHVDNSLTDPIAFLRTNVEGTFNLLELLRAIPASERPLLVHLSTDEVYGDAAIDATPEYRCRPSSPYAASKVAADAFIEAYGRTYGIRYRMVRPSNVYGPNQFPEKLIPKTVRAVLLGRVLPIHGGGTQTRSWLAMNDCVSAILAVLDKGKDGAIYNICGNVTASVSRVVDEIHRLMGHDNYIVTVTDERPGMDKTYSVNDRPLRDLGWVPQGNLWADLPALVESERRTPLTRF